MSQSGVPIVSQTAKATGTIVNSVGDIFKGKNVFEALGRIATSPTAATQAQLDQITFGKLRGVPIIGQQMKTSQEYLDNPYDKGSATRWGQGEAKLGATVIASFLTGGAAAGALGTSSAVGYGATALAANKIANGENVLDSVSPILGASNLIPKEFSDVQGLAGKISNYLPKAGSQNVSSFSSPSQILPVQNVSSGGINILLLGAGAVALFFVLRKII